MSVSRDDFSIAFRSALLQRGGAQKFSVLSLIFLALVIFFFLMFTVHNLLNLLEVLLMISYIELLF